jgi:hypothetical protein
MVVVTTQIVKAQASFSAVLDRRTEHGFYLMSKPSVCAFLMLQVGVAGCLSVK